MDKFDSSQLERFGFLSCDPQVLVLQVDAQDPAKGEALGDFEGQQAGSARLIKNPRWIMRYFVNNFALPPTVET